MTNREAIEILEEVKVVDDSIYAYNPVYAAALDKAIDSLRASSAASCDDTISRKAAIDPQCDMFCGSHIDCRFYPKCDNLKPLQDLPSAQPQTKCIAKITLNEEQLRDAVEKAKHEVVTVLPQRKRGRWIKKIDIWGGIVSTTEGYNCSECHAWVDGEYSYCPWCGADMREGEQDEG